jgi:hypothetical protein
MDTPEEEVEVAESAANDGLHRENDSSNGGISSRYRGIDTNKRDMSTFRKKQYNRYVLRSCNFLKCWSRLKRVSLAYRGR